MSGKLQSQSGNTALAVILSLILPGAGQLYRRRVAKGLVLILSFIIAIGIIWFAMSSREFKMFDWDGKRVMFNPAVKAIAFGEYAFKVTDIMKVTGTIQLFGTWIFALVDAWRDRENH